MLLNDEEFLYKLEEFYRLFNSKMYSKYLQHFLLIFILAESYFLVESFNENEKTIRPKSNVEQRCLDLLTIKNKTQIERCEFFKCFEERFPCGNKYWVMNWG